MTQLLLAFAVIKLKVLKQQIIYFYDIQQNLLHILGYKAKFWFQTAEQLQIGCSCVD